MSATNDPGNDSDETSETTVRRNRALLLCRTNSLAQEGNITVRKRKPAVMDSTEKPREAAAVDQEMSGLKELAADIIATNRKLRRAVSALEQLPSLDRLFRRPLASSRSGMQSAPIVGAR